MAFPDDTHLLFGELLLDNRYNLEQGEPLRETFDGYTTSSFTSSQVWNNIVR